MRDFAAEAKPQRQASAGSRRRDLQVRCPFSNCEEHRPQEGTSGLSRFQQRSGNARTVQDTHATRSAFVGETFRSDALPGIARSISRNRGRAAEVFSCNEAATREPPSNPCFLLGFCSRVLHPLMPSWERCAFATWEKRIAAEAASHNKAAMRNHRKNGRHPHQPHGFKPENKMPRAYSPLEASSACQRE